VRVASPLGLSVIFLNVLCDQLGLPVPAVPTLVVAGAMSADGRLPGGAVLGLAVAACMIGDCAWYASGRIFGARVMKLLCRVSLTPDSCVNETQSSFERWGTPVLIVAKFIPGLSLVAPPLAGATRMGLPRFLLFSLLGATLWVGAAMLGGLALKPQIDRLLPRLAGLGPTLVVLALVILAAWIAYKWWDRDRFHRALDMARISVGELHEHLSATAPPIVIDVRSSTAQSLELRRIPGALHVPLKEVRAHAGKLPRDRDIILYCTCPNEASAAEAAKLLMSHGFRRVRPLRGGLDAWVAAGYAVEQVSSTASAGDAGGQAAA